MKSCKKPLSMNLRTLARLVAFKNTDECIEWKRSLSQKGYAMMSVRVKGRTQHHKISRYIHNMTKGWSDGFVIMHSCDNPKCINPKHLVAGTQAKNIRDAASKGKMNGWKNRVHRCPACGRR